jgi:hypothetical protein
MGWRVLHFQLETKGDSEHGMDQDVEGDTRLVHCCD